MTKIPSRPATVYLRFLRLAESLHDSRCLPMLDPLEERLLVLIAQAGQQQKRLCVRDMMAKSELGSPAMLHRRLKSMREKGWIWLADTEDGRRKQLELTQDALQYFDKLSTCMLKATRTRGTQKASRPS
jgi:DNA-binding MarR family transcriptional regulator